MSIPPSDGVPVPGPGPGPASGPPRAPAPAPAPAPVSPLSAREEYARSQLAAAELDLDPLVQLRRWIDEAIGAELPEPTAMSLATVDADGAPDVRVVLLRGLDACGLRFYTNLGSSKARHLAATPRAAVVLHWQPLERQVRLRGPVEQLPAAESDAYFAGRPRGSQLGAWASEQSQPVADRAALDAAVAAVSARFSDVAQVPRPAFWGGYLLRPVEVEFWQGRPSRLHDRFRYRRRAEGDDLPAGSWAIERLQP